MFPPTLDELCLDILSYYIDSEAGLPSLLLERGFSRFYENCSSFYWNKRPLLRPKYASWLVSCFFSKQSSTTSMYIYPSVDQLREREASVKGITCSCPELRNFELPFWRWKLQIFQTTKYEFLRRFNKVIRLRYPPNGDFQCTCHSFPLSKELWSSLITDHRNAKKGWRNQIERN